jgi:hypothetical protein
MTRPYTPHEKTADGRTILHVHRCCENCGREIGDANAAELKAAMDGAPLPPVAEECGCPQIVEQIAMYTNSRDGIESGTVAWPDLDEAGRESYRKDATSTLRVISALGWLPKGAIA